MSLRLFASHDWGKNAGNHARVKEVVESLRGIGYSVWLDENEMRGNLVDDMCTGIDESDVVLVFVTRNYMKKVQSGNDGDNCRREFMYAQRRHGTSRMVTIRFDTDLPSKWSGPLGMLLGDRMYADLSVDHTSKDKMMELVRLFPTKMAARNAIKTTMQNTKNVVVAKKQMKTSAAESDILLPPVKGVGYRKDGVRGRVNRLMQEAGMSEKEGERTHEKLVRLMASMGIDTEKAPLYVNVARAEEQLGVQPES
jgi:hypothetical protein